eukprot:TRINITY_DN1733_c0_g1_i8.p1 TRINITY_DN1733_c0_g1~~TRINITY_DN1733_c0_g1_i8.p1  ORF type:complete len:100 (-),score=16.96 TRINITY_DN1733_c0_g1_i8:33-332(-)
MCIRDRFIGYIATSERAEALWVGVVLDERVGRHSGQACDGRYYFRCQHGFGLYARPECVEPWYNNCLLYTSDAADEEDSVDLGGRRIIKKKKNVSTSRL